MITFFQNWTNCILLTVIISGILEFITSEGETRKFVYLVLGVITSIVVISPIIGILNGNFDIEEVFDISNIEENSYYIQTLSQAEDAQREMLQKVYADGVIREFNTKYPHIKITDCNIQFTYDEDNKVKEIHQVNVYVEHSVEDISFVKEKIVQICEIDSEKVSVKLK